MARERTNLLPPTTIEFSEVERTRDKRTTTPKGGEKNTAPPDESNKQDPLTL